MYCKGAVNINGHLSFKHARIGPKVILHMQNTWKKKRRIINEALLMTAIQQQFSDHICQKCNESIKVYGSCVRK